MDAVTDHLAREFVATHGDNALIVAEKALAHARSEGFEAAIARWLRIIEAIKAA